MVASPAARTALAVGLLALALTVINQASAPADALLAPALQRAAVLAGILSVLLMLVGVLWSRVEPEAAARAPLQGREGLQLAEQLPEALRRELGWGSTMLLTATPAAVVLLQWRGRTLLRRGLLADTPFQPGPICSRCQERDQAISLVNLSLYPGRAEFEGLLAGLPSVLVQPIGSDGLLLLGGWSPRCFRRSDLIWVEGWARRLRDEWAPVLNAAPEPASPLPQEPGSD
ncbi:MAG: cofactor assembly of complex C subunit B [Synechococcaceae cyanobacterium]|nr:cofactor assembly of complex C subunit B [Synechococcaceae cyanobacterium]